MRRPAHARIHGGRTPARGACLDLTSGSEQKPAFCSDPDDVVAARGGRQEADDVGEQVGVIVHTLPAPREAGQSEFSKAGKTNMNEAQWAALARAAKAASGNAYARYSGFRVGAAVISDRGDVASGCNVENEIGRAHV